MHHERYRHGLSIFSPQLSQRLCWLLLIVSSMANASWLEFCPYPSLPDPLPAGYLSHILDSTQTVRLLRISAEPPNDPSCQVRQLSISTDDLAWVGFASPSDSQARRLGLLGQQNQQTFKVTEIVDIDASTATAHVKEESLPPKLTGPKASPIRHPRAAWFWSPTIWEQTPQRIFDAQTEYGLQRIYISLPFSEQRVSHANQLREFLQLAHQHGLQVWAVLGDPHAVLDDQRHYFLNLAKSIEAFNSEPDPNKLDGLQLDIEPYLLPGYQVNPGAWLKKQAETVAAVRQVTPSLPLDMVIPFWLNPEQKEGRELLTAVAAHLNSLTVMNYRTDLDQIHDLTEKFLAWGNTHNKPVFIALESLPMADQELRVYAQAAQGELWQIDFDSVKVLILLKQPRALSGEKAYRLSHTRNVVGGNTSFFQKPEALQDLISKIEYHFSDSPSFAGVALHGLDY